LVWIFKENAYYWYCSLDLSWNSSKCKRRRIQSWMWLCICDKRVICIVPCESSERMPRTYTPPRILKDLRTEGTQISWSLWNWDALCYQARDSGSRVPNRTKDSAQYSVMVFLMIRAKVSRRAYSIFVLLPRSPVSAT